ncbi:MAG: hypothetical protein KAX51_13390 [Chromatiaceae bacterium]|nr:hypothetical protein [Chromatiaceae bacterium]MBP8290771.1 hypothetical protein [Chromatiaceae bacterium]
MPTEETLRENKRECFDGMRAYHQSEISHANHAITMLLAMAAAIGAVVVAILFPDNPPAHVREIAWGLFAVVMILGGTIAGTAHIKISGDHTVYANFGAEYVKTSGRLGLYESSCTTTDGQTKNQDAIKTNRTVGQGPGYKKTQVIIWAFACVLTLLSLFFAITISYIA